MLITVDGHGATKRVPCRASALGRRLLQLAQPKLSRAFIGCRAAHLGREAYGLFAGSDSGETDSRDQSAGPGKSDADYQVEEG